MPLYSINDVLEIVDVGSSDLDANSSALTIQLKGPKLSEDETDAESLETAPVFGALGLVSRPYPADDTGNAQAAFIRGANVIVGMRDTRSASVVGKLSPGDVCVHSTGPKHTSRIFLKEETRQTVLMADDSNGKNMILMLDGKTDQVVISAFKQVITMRKEQGITLSTGLASINIGVDGTISLHGNVVVAGKLNAPQALVAVVTACPAGAGTGTGTLA